MIPDGDGAVNPAGVAHDHRLIIECIRHGTLQDKGGWSSRATVDAFVRYAETAFREYGDAADPAQAQRELHRPNHHMTLAQARVTTLCHEIVPAAEIEPAPDIALVYPQSSRPVAVHGTCNPTA
ncbi:family 1 glycosylhydrolase [Streptomyces sp. NPDC091371]|uniref:family 1 glycosylhydrolase n=1 Tax=Streptomyces sp. NPDC091371 TaxID=3155303 RepID=UPI0034318452